MVETATHFESLQKVVPETKTVMEAVDNFVIKCKEISDALKTDKVNELNSTETLKVIDTFLKIMKGAERVVSLGVKNGTDVDGFIYWLVGKVKLAKKNLGTECQWVKISVGGGVEKLVPFSELFLPDYTLLRLQLARDVQLFDSAPNDQKAQRLSNATSSFSALDVSPLVRLFPQAQNELAALVKYRHDNSLPPITLSKEKVAGFQITSGELKALRKLLESKNIDSRWLADVEVLKNYFIRSRYFYDSEIKDLNLEHPEALLRELNKIRQMANGSEKVIEQTLAPITEDRLNTIITYLDDIVNSSKDRTVELLLRPIENMHVFDSSKQRSPLALKTFLNMKSKLITDIKDEGISSRKKQKIDTALNISLDFLSQLNRYRIFLESDTRIPLVNEAKDSKRGELYRKALIKVVNQFIADIESLQNELKALDEEEPVGDPLDPTKIDFATDNPEVIRFSGYSITRLITDLVTNSYNDESSSAFKIVLEAKLRALAIPELTEFIGNIEILFEFRLMSNSAINTNYLTVNYEKLVEGFARKADGIGVYDGFRSSSMYQNYVEPIAAEMIREMENIKGQFAASKDWNNGTELSDMALAKVSKNPAYQALLAIFPPGIQDMGKLFARVALYDLSLRDIRTKLAAKHQAYYRKAWKHADGSPVKMDSLPGLWIYKVSKAKDRGWLSTISGFIDYGHRFLDNALNRDKRDVISTNYTVHEREHSLESYYSLLFNQDDFGHYVMDHYRAHLNTEFPFPHLDDLWSAPINSNRKRSSSENPNNFLKSNEYMYKLIEDTAKAWQKSQNWKGLNKHDFEASVTKLISDMLSTASQAISYISSIEDSQKRSDCQQIVRRCIDQYIIYLFSQLPFKYSATSNKELVQPEYQQKYADLKKILTAVIGENNTFNPFELDKPDSGITEYDHNGTLVSRNSYSYFWLETVNDPRLEKRASWEGRIHDVRGYNERHLVPDFEGFLAIFKKVGWYLRNNGTLNEDPHFPFKEISDIDPKKESK